MYTSHDILAFNIIYMIKFDFKCTLKSFCLLFIFIETHIINIIYIVIVYLRIIVPVCLIFRNIIFLLMSVNFFLSCRLMPAVISRPDFRIFRNKVSQDLIFIWWISRSMDETSLFGSILQMIYISFSALDRLIS